IGFAILLTVIILRHIIMLFATRLLAPVESLARGIERVKNRDYTVRVPPGSDDELGLLVGAFNDTVEGLNELAIGTTVQVSLLPPENHR
ncbi:MAG TPA: HAMP domain-containing protein, partial [Candidatus Rifleibacterium sp.]|nr:HAMP domain-containing protein [Candidatus Rifleibacterium sp.]